MNNHTPTSRKFRNVSVRDGASIEHEAELTGHVLILGRRSHVSRNAAISGGSSWKDRVVIRNSVISGRALIRGNNITIVNSTITGTAKVLSDGVIVDGVTLAYGTICGPVTITKGTQMIEAGPVGLSRESITVLSDGSIHVGGVFFRGYECFEKAVFKLPLSYEELTAQGYKSALKRTRAWLTSLGSSNHFRTTINHHWRPNPGSWMSM